MDGWMDETLTFYHPIALSQTIKLSLLYTIASHSVCAIMVHLHMSKFENVLG